MQNPMPRILLTGLPGFDLASARHRGGERGDLARFVPLEADGRPDLDGVESVPGRSREELNPVACGTDSEKLVALLAYNKDADRAGIVAADVGAEFAVYDRRRGRLWGPGGWGRKGRPGERQVEFVPNGCFRHLARVNRKCGPLRLDNRVLGDIRQRDLDSL